MSFGNGSVEDEQGRTGDGQLIKTERMTRDTSDKVMLVVMAAGVSMAAACKREPARIPVARP